MGAFYFHVGMSERSDMELVGQRKTKEAAAQCICRDMVVSAGLYVCLYFGKLKQNSLKNIVNMYTCVGGEGGTHVGKT